MTGIYKIQSPSGRVYIGQSWDIEKRWKSHRSGNSRCRALINSFKKYGIDGHNFSVIHELPNDVSEEVMNNFEIYYIDAYKTAGCKMANIKSGGYKGGKGHTVSEEGRRKISERNRGNTHRKGVKLSEETISKMKKSLKGRKVWCSGIPMAEETKKKLSEINKGKKLSAQTKQKISNYQKGKIISESTKSKIGLAHKGKVISQEQREVLRIKNTGKKHSEETKRKMSEAHKRYRQNKKLCHTQ